MLNRIRHYRKRAGLTLEELAKRVRTSAQTISRLETEVMTVSTDWLERIGEALGVHPSELLEKPEGGDIAFIGRVGTDGAVSTVRGEQKSFVLDIPAERAVAVTLADAIGPYSAGETLIGNRFEGEDLSNAVGHDCIVGLADGRIMLRRVIKGSKERYTLVPFASGGDVRHGQAIRWAARIVMRVRYV